MSDRNITWRGTILLAAGTLIGAAGCESDRSAMAEFFPSGEARRPAVFANAQAEAGARHDATLRAFHFDGAELNSLGREKLDLMTSGREEHALTVYLDFAEGDGMDARRDRVLEYLGGKGMDEAKLKFVSGPNPDATSPAAGHLGRMNRTEGEGTPGGGEGAGYLPAPMTGATSN